MWQLAAKALLSGLLITVALYLGMMQVGPRLGLKL